MGDDVRRVMNRSSRFIVVRNKEGIPYKRFFLKKRFYWFGSDENCDLVIRRPEVSKRHCAIQADVDHGKVWLIPIEMGEFVVRLNGAPVSTKTQLCHRDLFVICSRVFEYHQVDSVGTEESTASNLQEEQPFISIENKRSLGEQTVSSKSSSSHCPGIDQTIIDSSSSVFSDPNSVHNDKNNHNNNEKSDYNRNNNYFRPDDNVSACTNLKPNSNDSTCTEKNSVHPSSPKLLSSLLPSKRIKKQHPELSRQRSLLQDPVEIESNVHRFKVASSIFSSNNHNPMLSMPVPPLKRAEETSLSVPSLGFNINIEALNETSLVQASDWNESKNAQRIMENKSISVSLATPVSGTGIFRGMNFIFTGRDMRIRLYRERDMLECIERNGGRVLLSFDDLVQSESHLMCSSIILLAMRPVLTPKYLYCLMRAIPCVNFQWLLDCLEKNIVIPFDAYMLFACDDQNRVGIPQSRICMKPIFRSMSILVWCHTKGYNEWSTILKMNGANIIEAFKPRSPTVKETIDLVIWLEEYVNEEGLQWLSYLSGNERNQKASQSETSTLLELNADLRIAFDGVVQYMSTVPLVGIDWLLFSIVAQQRIPFDYEDLHPPKLLLSPELKSQYISADKMLGDVQIYTKSKLHENNHSLVSSFGKKFSSNGNDDNEKPTFSTFSTLGTDLQRLIFSFLLPHQLAIAQLVNSEWRKVACDSSLWNHWMKRTLSYCHFLEDNTICCLRDYHLFKNDYRFVLFLRTFFCVRTFDILDC